MVSFISGAFVVVKLSIFKCFHGDAVSMKWPLLGGFWALSSVNMTWVSRNFDQRYVKKCWLKCKSFKIKCLNGNKTYPKLMVLVHFGSNFSTKKPKYCQKPKFFPENTSLWLSNNTGPRSQINHKILIKLIKKKQHFFGQVWTFWGKK